ncbi:MAG: tRNA-intron lyase [Candidatus Bathyarchaeota archaeon]|jgi:tRNA-intron endonuclease
METFSAVVSGGEIVVPALNEANSLYQDGYGSLLRDRKVLSIQPFEALYLVERGKVSVFDEETRDRLVFQELLQRLSCPDPEIWTRYLVYRDLRTRGFVVKAHSGSGVSFLVYERGSYGKKLPKYLVHAVWEGSHETLSSLSEVLDTAVDADKILRLAVVDRRGEIVYYTLSDKGFREQDPR